MGRLARAVIVYLNAQIAAGAQAVQLFDSWVGCLGPDDYRQYVLPYVQQVIAGITPGVPVISFATGNPQLLPLLAEGGASVIGVDWRVRLDDAWQMIGHDRAIQGNLDPMALLADTAELRRRASGHPASKPPAGPATSSTWATACCRRRRPTTRGRWSRSCTKRTGSITAYDDTLEFNTLPRALCLWLTLPSATSRVRNTKKPPAFAGGYWQRAVTRVAIGHRVQCG